VCIEPRLDVPEIEMNKAVLSLYALFHREISVDWFMRRAISSSAHVKNKFICPDVIYCDYCLPQFCRKGILERSAKIILKTKGLLKCFHICSSSQNTYISRKILLFKLHCLSLVFSWLSHPLDMETLPKLSFLYIHSFMRP